MATTTISIEVDADAARAFSEATAEERRKLQLLLSLRLRELTFVPGRSLKEIMDDIGARAEQQGLTAESLESCLQAAQRDAGGSRDFSGGNNRFAGA